MPPSFIDKDEFARLFISINLDASFFMDIQSKLLEIHSFSKISPVKDFHMTLRFFGDVKRDNIPELCEKLSKIDFNRFSFSVERIDSFHDREPYVIFASVTKDDSLMKLVDDISFVFGKDSRDFLPHITLMRLKKISDKKKCLDIINTIEIEPKKFFVNEICLMESVLTKMGPIYSVIKHFDAKK